MRNDVKLGFAIGGVLLAVLIVYVLVVPGGSGANKQVARNQATSNGEEKPTLVPIVPATQPSVPPAAAPADFTPTVSTPDDAALVKKDAQSLPQSGTVASAASSSSANNSTAGQTPSAVSGKDIDWNKLLNSSPTLIAQTPVSADSAHVSKRGESASTAIEDPTAPAASANTSAPQTGDIAAGNTPPATDPPPAMASGTSPVAGQLAGNLPIATNPLTATNSKSIAEAHTHVVQAHETLSTIAAAAYGNANLYPAILRANPGIDANRLKVGATLNLPALSDVKPSGADAQKASAKIGPSKKAVDPSKQYVVESGDSLYRISVKLYGKSTMSDSLYEANKQTIGDDPKRLKVGQVLTLPQPPTVTASANAPR